MQILSGEANVQNILIHTSQQQKKKKKLKMDKGHEQIFFQRRHKNGQHIHENVLNLNNQQGNINQNHSVTLLQINFIPLQMDIQFSLHFIIQTQT